MLNQLGDITFFSISKVIHIIMFVVYFSQECDFTHNNRSDILYDSLLKYHIKLYSFTYWILKAKYMTRSKNFLTFDTLGSNTKVQRKWKSILSNSIGRNFIFCAGSLLNIRALRDIVNLEVWTWKTLNFILVLDVKSISMLFNVVQPSSKNKLDSSS